VTAPSALPAAERGQVAARLTALSAALPYVLGQRTDAVIIGLILAASAGPGFATVPAPGP
jgi:hypothetical protein